MSDNAYQRGRLDLPFVGHCTFAKSPACVDWNAIDADVAVIGVPNDMGTQWRPGARFGPRAIREASTLFSFGHAGAYDHEDDVMYLTRDQARIVDVGDADIVHTQKPRQYRVRHPQNFGLWRHAAGAGRRPFGARASDQSL